ncbi:MAG: RNA polymerase sigma factor [Chloroflexota bacterium]|nr:RNA polymerase sigma factor [Chloroflexota bacterium]
MAEASEPRFRLLSAPAIDPGSDAELLSRAKGDRVAFAALYRRYVTPVYRYCLHRLGDPSAAEDATSDTFLKAFAALHRCREGAAFRGWLFAIAHNVVTDAWRVHHPTAPIDAAAEVADSEPGPEWMAERTDGTRRVRELLARLTPQQARIVELRLAGLTGPEIAAVLDCSLASVKIGQVRGYQRLRDVLHEQRGEEERH